MQLSCWTQPVAGIARIRLGDEPDLHRFPFLLGIVAEEVGIHRAEQGFSI